MDNLKQFSNLMKGFLDYVGSICKNDKKIKGTCTNINTLLYVNPRLVMTEYQKNITPYKKELFEKNEDFFINLNINSPELSTIIYSIKSKWGSLQEKEKEKIFSYILKLYCLSSYE